MADEQKTGQSGQSQSSKPGDFKPKTLHHKTHGSKTVHSEQEHQSALKEGYTEEDPSQAKEKR